jgi:hypothetical protein
LFQSGPRWEPYWFQSGKAVRYRGPFRDFRTGATNTCTIPPGRRRLVLSRISTRSRSQVAPLKGSGPFWLAVHAEKTLDREKAAECAQAQKIAAHSDHREERKMLAAIATALQSKNR